MDNRQYAHTKPMHEAAIRAGAQMLQRVSAGLAQTAPNAKSTDGSPNASWELQRPEKANGRRVF
jgi:hypothetical protein